jgi:hypothetical protein
LRQLIYHRTVSSVAFWTLITGCEYSALNSVHTWY